MKPRDLLAATGFLLLFIGYLAAAWGLMLLGGALVIWAIWRGGMDSNRHHARAARDTEGRHHA